VTRGTVEPPHIDGHRYEARLAAGGHSVVFRYYQESLDRRVAVKVITTSGAGARVKEANAMARLNNHANIVQVFSTGEAGGHAYIVMAYCPGPDLWKLLEVGPFDVRKVVRVGVQIAGAVRAAHDIGIVHRDIKPANILTDEYSKPRLTDFGIAGLVAAAPGEEKVGLSLPWSPPEVLRGGRGGVASDIYSLGATLWNLLVGRSPFEVPGRRVGAAELEQRILHQSAPRTGRADVPAALEDLLARMLDPLPARRPASAKQVETELAAIELALGGPVDTEAPWHAGASPVPLPPPDTETSLRAHKEMRPHEEMRAHDDELTRTSLHRVPLLHETGRPVEHTARRDLPAAPPAPQERVEAPRRHRWVWPVAAALVVAAGIAVPLAARGHATPAADPPTQDSGGVQDAGAGGDVAPPGPPDVVGTRVDANSVRFTWTYSAALASDTFAWRTADSTRSGVAGKPVLDLTDPTGTEVCLQVKVIRVDGRDAAVDWPRGGCVR
jgi:hypothetical protein